MFNFGIKRAMVRTCVELKSFVTSLFVLFDIAYLIQIVSCFSVFYLFCLCIS